MNDLPRLLQKSVRLPLFVMLRRLAHPEAIQEALKEGLDEHLSWMIAQEQAGRVFLSGPFQLLPNDDLMGLTILRVADETEAHKVADSDPFVRRGYVRYELRRWTAFEGSLQMSIRLSDSSVVFT